MGLREYADAGVPDLLERAADVLAERGLAKGLRYQPADGSVDLVAALALAAGARPSDVMSSVTLLDLGVPAVAEGPLHAALDVLDALCPEVEAWADAPDVTASDVERLLRQAAMRLRIAVT
jgi:hypothetical protein